MKIRFKWLGLQLFADGGGDGGGGSAAGDGATAGTAPATTGENTPAAEENRLRELGVPEAILQKRANRKSARRQSPVVQQTAQTAEPKTAPAADSKAQDASAQNNAAPQSNATDAPKRMTWDEIMADPEYNKQMQSTIQARLKNAKSAEENLSKLTPAIELLARKYGLDAANLDVEKLTNAINDDDSYYEDKALEMGVSVETAKKIDQSERETARRQAEEARTIEQQKIENHIAKLQQQGDALKKTFPQFDLATELRNPAFARMTSPNVGISVEDAYYAVHRNEIQTAAMQVTAQRTAEQMANAIRAGQARPQENGTSAQAPSNTTFDYAHASKDQREAIKKQIRDAAARGQKIYPGQFR